MDPFVSYSFSFSFFFFFSFSLVGSSDRPWNLPHCRIIKRTTWAQRGIGPRWLQRNLRRKIHAISPRKARGKNGVESFKESASLARISECISGNEKPSKEQSRWRIHLCIPTPRIRGFNDRTLCFVLRDTSSTLQQTRTPQVSN